MKSHSMKVKHVCPTKFCLAVPTNPFTNPCFHFQHFGQIYGIKCGDEILRDNILLFSLILQVSLIGNLYKSSFTHYETS